MNVPKKPNHNARHFDVNQPTLSSKPPPDSMDSTLFFPVGSPVKHKLHGRGVVQTPPDSDSEFSRKMLVRVKDVNQPTLRSEPPPDSMDSTLFFPVGSPVKHKLHGRGVVQTPPDSDSEFSRKMLVRVKFIEESTEWDLPMNGLVHTYD
jgi:hypothetical protein